MTRGEHSLYRQSWTPRMMRGGGTTNADGYGVAWWDDGGAHRYRTSSTVWSDAALTDLLPHIEASATLASIRSATAGNSLDANSGSPFVDARWAFCHNGAVPDWRAALSGLVDRTGLGLELEGACDSAALWLLVRHALATETPAAALTRVIRDVKAASPGSRLNFLLSDGETLWGTTVFHSLFVRQGFDFVMLASEPTDGEDGWTEIADNQLVIAKVGSVDIQELGIISGA